MLGIFSVTVFRSKNYNGFPTPWVRDYGMVLRVVENKFWYTFVK